jgi:hypothetical protein
MIDKEMAFDPLEFVREYRENYVNLYSLWTTVEKPPVDTELTTPAETPIMEKELPAPLSSLLADYLKQHSEASISFVKYMRSENGKAVRVIEDDSPLPEEGEFLSLGMTTTLNTSQEGRVVTELFVAKLGGGPAMS